jgi:hypothetical protein
MPDEQSFRDHTYNPDDPQGRSSRQTLRSFSPPRGDRGCKAILASRRTPGTCALKAVLLLLSERAPALGNDANRGSIATPAASAVPLTPVPEDA